MTNALKEVGLMFTPDNHAAILSGIKTQTRRKLKFPKSRYETDSLLSDDEWVERFILNHAQHWVYGNPTKQLISGYVKERYEILHIISESRDKQLVTVGYRELPGYPATSAVCVCSYNTVAKLQARKNPTQGGPMFMPKALARTWFAITDVKPQKLGSITPEDAVAEGIELDPDVVVDNSEVERYSWAFSKTWRDYINGGYDLAPDQSFVTLWESIHGLGSWDAEQWVWTISFDTVGCKTK